MNYMISAASKATNSVVKGSMSYMEATEILEDISMELCGIGENNDPEKRTMFKEFEACIDRIFEKTDFEPIGRPDIAKIIDAIALMSAALRGDIVTVHEILGGY